MFHLGLILLHITLYFANHLYITSDLYKELRVVKL